jgi:GNAT superfamily N-acetyltransferase
MAQGSHEADPLVIRPAVASDAELITNLIRELAVYEKLEHAVKATPSSLRAMLFERTPPAAESLVAEWEGQAAGFALFFATFSTFRAQTGLYLEDLFVRPEFRGRGIGKALLSELARLGVAVAGSSGPCWIGTNRPSSSIRHTARGRFRTGSRTVSMARRSCDLRPCALFLVTRHDHDSCHHDNPGSSTHCTARGLCSGRAATRRRISQTQHQ